MKEIDINIKLQTYDDVKRGDGVNTGLMSEDVKLVAEKVNEIVRAINNINENIKII